MSDVAAFFSDDPRAGAQAVGELAQSGVAGLELVLPASGPAPGYPSRQVDVRLRQLAQRIGAEAVPVLLDRIAQGEWFTKVLAAPAFAAFDGDPTAQTGLMNLARSSDIDVQRKAVEALGYASTSGCAGLVQQIAYFGDTNPTGGRRFRPDLFGKLGRFATVAILMMFAKGGSRGQLDLIQELIEQADKHLSGGQGFDFDVDQVMRGLNGVVAADALIDCWLDHPSDRFRRFALLGLGALRMHRTIEAVAARIAFDPSPTVEVAAGIALGEVIDGHAAAVLARLLTEQRNLSPGGAWAFSILYAIDAEWPSNVPVLQCLRQEDDVGQQMLFTLGLRGDAAHRPAMERGLHDSRPWVRATSAPALARLLGHEAEPLLAPLADEGSSAFERALALAALIHAGRHDLGERLHSELCKFDQLSQVRRCWARELLSAVELASGKDDAELWSDIVGEPLSRVRRDLGLLTRRPLEGGEKEAATVAVERVPRATQAGKQPRPLVFISYSHKDQSWLDRLLRMLAPGVAADQIDPWSDRRLEAGDQWRQEIERAMNFASVAVFLVSSDFQDSRFIQDVELKRLLAAAEQHGLRVIWIAVRPSLYDLSPLSAYQSANDPARPLSSLTKAKSELALANIARTILQAASSAAASPALP